MICDIYPVLMLSIAVIIFPYNSFIRLFGCKVYKNVLSILSFLKLFDQISVLYNNGPILIHSISTLTFFLVSVNMIKLIFPE